MKKSLFIFAILFSSLAFAQRPVFAPDFGITDSLGNTQYLYEDVLEQNKAAILIFFSVSCSSCYGAVPTINNWYNTFGQNQENVIIWAFEIAGFSTDADVYDFHQNYGTEYPLFNTHEADSVDSLFNVGWTPFYFVICPDGSHRGVDIDVVPNAVNYCLEMVNISEETQESPQLRITEGLISLDNPDDRMYKMLVYSVDGRKVKDLIFEGNELIDPELKPGLYLYRVSDDTGKPVTSGKFIY